MTALRATFHFELRGLCVAQDLLGTSHEIVRDGHRVRVTLPAEERRARGDDGDVDPTIFPDAERLPLMEGGGLVSGGVSAVPSESFASIDSIRAEGGRALAALDRLFGRCARTRRPGNGCRRGTATWRSAGTWRRLGKHCGGC